ncbi:hypothetical protein M885DRAFT_448463 [Pelagophyceae sp. CCMP2097]|nr:hypothetical protein M885DRAFT_448463 [Pelagophyceae sp. CCMP2097]
MNAAFRGAVAQYKGTPKPITRAPRLRLECRQDSGRNNDRASSFAAGRRGAREAGTRAKRVRVPSRVAAGCPGHERRPSSHTQRVCRLYKQALKTTLDWAVKRSIWAREADKLRIEFDEGAKLPLGSAKAIFLINEAERRLAARIHPEPYVLPYMPGGSKFMRNAPLPLEVCWDGRDNIPEGAVETYKAAFRNIDMTRVVPGEKAMSEQGQVFVDNSTRQYWTN